MARTHIVFLAADGHGTTMKMRRQNFVSHEILARRSFFFQHTVPIVNWPRAAGYRITPSMYYNGEEDSSLGLPLFRDFWLVVEGVKCIKHLEPTGRRKSPADQMALLARCFMLFSPLKKRQTQQRATFLLSFRVRFFGAPKFFFINTPIVNWPRVC